MGKSLSFKIVIALALAQAIGGVLRALDWVEIGVDLFGEGLLLLPFVGLLAVMRGLLIALVALLYLIFVCGALLGQSWARWLGLAAAVINLLLALGLLAQGAPAASAIAWAVIPGLLIAYLFSPTGRAAFQDAD